MPKSLSIHLLGREYRLLVREEDVDVTREIAAYVDAKMTAFRRAHPEQPELTAAVITALALAEELYSAREDQDALRDAVDAQADALTARLDEALAGGETADGLPAEDVEPLDEGTA